MVQIVRNAGTSVSIPVDLSSLTETVPEKITKDEINELPLVRYEGPIHLVDAPDKVGPALEAITKDPVIGFDTETRPVFKKGQSFPTALIQMATDDGVWLFQLNKLEGIQPLTPLLCDPTIFKVGVALRDDFVKLRELEDFVESGVIDIADMTQRLGIVNTGLRSLSAIFLQFRISKAAQVSNWGRVELSEAQVVYAATDAWASRELFLKVRDLGVPMQPYSISLDSNPDGSDEPPSTP